MDVLDEEPQWEGTDTFAGGQVSNTKPNRLQPNQVALMQNLDLSPLGDLTTRRGLKQIGNTLAGMIQGIAYYKTPAKEQLIVAEGGILRKFDGIQWVQVNPFQNRISPDTLVIFVQGVDILYIAQTDSPLRRYAPLIEGGEPGVSEYPTDGAQEVTAIQTTGVTAVSLADTYFTIFDDEAGVYVWFNLDLAGDDPAPTGYPRGIEVAVSTGESTGDIAQAIANALDADSKFSATRAGDDILVTDITEGSREDATAGTSPLRVDVATQGVTENRLPPVGIGALVWHTDSLVASGVSATPDTVYFSQFFDGSVWDRANWSIRVGAGEGDPVTGLVPWTNYNLIVLKQHSIWLVGCNPTQAVSEFQINRIHDRIGTRAPRTWVQIGTDVFGLAESGGKFGVRTIKNIIASEQQKEVGPPLSLPVQDIMGRITESAIGTAHAFHWENRYLLAIPVDGSPHPNYVLVFNTITETWSGFWTGWTAMFFAERTHGETKKLWMGQSNGTIADFMDYIPDSQETESAFQDLGQPIPSRIRSKAFTANQLVSQKTGDVSRMEFDGSNCDVTATLILDNKAPLEWRTFAARPDSMLTIPFVLPFTLPAATITPKAFDLLFAGQWREMQIQLSTTRGKLALKSLALSTFIDSPDGLERS